jgi:hypothetical protein
VSNSSSIVACVFIATVAFLPRHCLAIGGYTYRHTDWWEGFKKYAVDIGSGAMIYIPSFTKIGSAIQKLMGGIYREHGDCTSLLLYFRSK